MVFSMGFAAKANVNTYITVEEVKINDAIKALPEVSSQFSQLINEFTRELKSIKNSKDLTDTSVSFAQELWLSAGNHVQTEQTFDDRALYWGRLQLTRTLRTSTIFYQLQPEQQQTLMFAVELASRGLNDVKFDKQTDKKILITGFDPFYLHRNIQQSNPSGIAALALDNTVIEHQGKSVEIQSLMIPVRFADFDQGLIETMLSELIKSKQLNMLATISMGRKNFDLERFPGRRRSSVAPGNLGVFTGATNTNPLIPFLDSKPLIGPEFVEFSLPVKAMQKAEGPYKVVDNAKVETLEEGWIVAQSLTELNAKTAVNGSGGGYLSNEISYRSILLRNQFAPTLAVGHIHTPKITEWKKSQVSDIVKQIQQMLTLSIEEI